MRVLMVCLGNICRSPMAEGIMRGKVNEKNLNWEIDSAGTSNFHTGEAPDIRSINKMKAYNLDISSLRARQFTVKDFEAFDLILAMDESNYANILKLAKNDAQREKVKMILDYAFPGQRMSVPDPYYGGDSGFENVYRLLNEACDRVILHHHE